MKERGKITFSAYFPFSDHTLDMFLSWRLQKGLAWTNREVLRGSQIKTIGFVATDTTKELEPRGIDTPSKLRCGGFYTNEWDKY